MNELALFAGAGGGILGGKLLGWRTRCAVEIDAYARRVLLARQRDGILDQFPIWDDVRTFDGRPWRGAIDVISGGFPCQDISAAGKGRGIEGERSGLWKEFARIIGEVGPNYILVENSPLLVSRGLGRVLGDLSEMGFNAEWGVIGAHHAGAPHKRDRIWIVAYSKCFGQQAASNCEFNSPASNAWKTDQLGSGSEIPNAAGIGSQGGNITAGCREMQGQRLSAKPSGICGGDRSQALGDSIRSRLEGYAGNGQGAGGWDLQDRSISETGLRIAGWKRVVYSGDCDEYGICPGCGDDFSDCGCPGPTMDECEYREIDGVLYARPKVWFIEPAVGRVAHGVAHRVDRLKAIGNGQVPAVAALAWRILNIG